MLERIPEQDIVMDDHHCVSAFDEAGLNGGPLFPIYHFNSLGYSRLLPKGAQIVDLFCGPARFLEYLLRGRPDLSAIGIDLSAEMLAVAEANMRAAGLADRVQLLQGDAALAAELVPNRVDGVSSLSALHHCPTKDHFGQVLRAIKTLQSKGAAVWLFDLVRPESEKWLDLLPAMHEMSQQVKLSDAFKTDWKNSLRAGWTFAEFEAALDIAHLDLRSSQADYSQLHWSCLRDQNIGQDIPWCGPALSPKEQLRATRLKETLDI